MSTSDRELTEDEILEKYSQTAGITQTLERDILQFLSAKYTKNATLSVAEIMKFYDCPEARARRVIAALMQDGVLVAYGKDTYRVTV